MNYFVTGATGFIGKFLIGELLAREDAKVYALVRASSQDKFDALKTRYGDAGKRRVAIHGDVTEPGLVSAADAKKQKGPIDNVLNPAAGDDKIGKASRGERRG